MTSWHQKNTVLSKTPLRRLHSILVLRYILNQNGRHGCLLAYTSKALTSAGQTTFYVIYLHNINASSAFLCPLVWQPEKWQRGKRRAKPILSWILESQILLFVRLHGRGDECLNVTFTYTSLNPHPASYTRFERLIKFYI